MQRLSARTGLYPSRFSLHVPWPAATDEPVTSGGFADIYKVNLQGKQMCCKMIRMYEKSQIEHMAKVFAREAIVWAQLLHPNILPFCGLLKLQSRLSFVSFWAANGALGDYLARNPQANRLLLVRLPKFSGVEYLHKNDIIHADLKGANVLIDSSGRASLGDFGLSNVMDPEIIKWTSLSTLASEGGSTRWHAPELLQSEDAFDDKVYATKASDVYAWAGICYEIFTGRLPFFEASETVFVMYMIMQGNIPTRPQDDDPAWLMHGLNDHIWKLMEDCWTSQHSERPSISEVIARLNSERPNDDRPPGDWGWNPFQRFCSSQSNPRMETLAYLQGLEKLLLRIMPEMT
ncbi:Ephrin type-A receptor 2 [Termitomyces sp. J132]|nr:Ephrin type-A receptor 2 [Termitomyces sp. J132]